MAYYIHKSTGEPVVVPDNVISDEFYNPNANGAGKGVGIRLLGRNVIDYGASVAQNFLQLASNFADDTAPSNSTAQQGQLWYNTVSKEMMVNVGSYNNLPATWESLGGGSNKPAIGTPLHSMTGEILGYASAYVPTKETTADYVPINVNENEDFIGWLRKTEGAGMTVPVLDAADNSLIGYAFPPTA